MERRAFGSTGLTVSALGLGAGQLGADDLDDAEAGRLLNAALDLGVTLIDTACGYGQSEARIGRHLAHRRGEFVLSTKGGYGVDGVADWTAACVARGIDQALARLRTDRLDVFHLHSCPVELIERDDLRAALAAARQAGKIGVAAYSGEGAALARAVALDDLGAVQCSVNLCDQRSLAAPLPAAAARGLGVIGKRPIANAPWRFAARPVGDYAEIYWQRFTAMGWAAADRDWADVALRFSGFAPGVATVIVGTRSLAHLRANVERIGRGPLDAALVAELTTTFAAHDRDWVGQV